jgi:hypothetical protein
MLPDLQMYQQLLNEDRSVELSSLQKIRYF